MTRLNCRILDLGIQRYKLPQVLAAKEGIWGIGKYSRMYRKLAFLFICYQMPKVRSTEKNVIFKLYGRFFLSTEFPGDEY